MRKLAPTLGYKVEISKRNENDLAQMLQKAISVRKTQSCLHCVVGKHKQWCQLILKRVEIRITFNYLAPEGIGLIVHSFIIVQVVNGVS